MKSRKKISLFSAIQFFSLFFMFASRVNAEDFLPPQIIPNAEQVPTALYTGIAWGLFGLFFVCIIFLFVALYKKPRNFSKREALQTARRLMGEHLFTFFVPLLIIQYLVVNIPELITYVLSTIVKVQGLSSVLVFSDSLWLTLYSGGMSLLKLVLFSLVSMGMIGIALDTIDGRTPKFQKLFSYFRFLPQFIVAWALSLVATALGSLLLIIPGIIVGIMVSLWPYVMVDKKYGPIKSLKASTSVVGGAPFDLFLFWFLLMMINVLGFLCFGIGLFVTIPITLLASAHVYRQLIQRHEKTL